MSSSISSPSALPFSWLFFLFCPSHCDVLGRYFFSKNTSCMCPVKPCNCDPEPNENAEGGNGVNRGLSRRYGPIANNTLSYYISLHFPPWCFFPSFRLLLLFFFSMDPIVFLSVQRRRAACVIDVSRSGQGFPRLLYGYRCSRFISY